MPDLGLVTLPADLTLEIYNHLTIAGYTLISLPEPPRGGPARAAFVVEKDQVRYLFLVVLPDEDQVYLTTPDQRSDQYLLQKRQLAAHTRVILVTGPPWEIPI